MQRKVIISCAVTGSADSPGKNPAVPVTPEQIANSCVDAAKAGAAVVHIHVRNPKTTKPSMDGALYREVVERIRSSGTDVLINLTTGPGARFEHDPDDPSKAGPASTMRGPDERVRHIQELRPDICSLDMGSLNMGNRVFINTPAHLQAMALAIKEAGVLPELEVFETGHLLLAKKFLEAGYVKGPGMFQICLGIAWGQPATPEAMMYMRNLLPRARRGLPSASRCISSRWWRRPCCSAATCGSGSRTISIWGKASSRPATPRWSRRPAASSRSSATIVATPNDAREILGLPAARN